MRKPSIKYGLGKQTDLVKVCVSIVKEKTCRSPHFQNNHDFFKDDPKKPKKVVIIIVVLLLAHINHVLEVYHLFLFSMLQLTYT